MSQGHDEDIFEQIEQEVPRLRRYARSLAKNPEAADDLVQDCLVRAISKIDSWQPGTNLRAWLMTILRNKFLNDCRKLKRERKLFLEQDAADVGFVPAQQEVRLHMATFEDAFQKLSRNHREALMLVTVEGYPYEEAAKILDISIGTLKSRISRARSNLRRHLDITEENQGPVGKTQAKWRRSCPPLEAL